MARDGYRIFDSDTHVGPDAAILERYLSQGERTGSPAGGIPRDRAHRAGDLYRSQRRISQEARRR